MSAIEFTQARSCRRSHSTAHSPSSQAEDGAGIDQSRIDRKAGSASITSAFAGTATCRSDLPRCGHPGRNCAALDRLTRDGHYFCVTDHDHLRLGMAGSEVRAKRLSASVKW
jgi:hypothetical protein